MPNIEVHGYADKATEIRNKIQEALKEFPHSNEIVVTIYEQTSVNDLDGRHLPFLRVVSSLDNLEDLLEHLKSLCEDIEVIALHRWIPANKKR